MEILHMGEKKMMTETLILHVVAARTAKPLVVVDKKPRQRT